MPTDDTDDLSKFKAAGWEWNGVLNAFRPDEVYVVTSGQYSGYRIEAVFSDQAAAERFAGPETDDYDSMRVEVFKLWHGDLPTTPFLRLESTIDASGHITDHERWGKARVDSEDGAPTRPECNSYGPKDWAFHPRPPEIHFSVEGTDVERVRKVYSEMRASTLANFDTLLHGILEARKARRSEAAQWLAPMTSGAPEGYQKAFDAKWAELFPHGQTDPDA